VYAATTKDESNSADGRFSASCQILRRIIGDRLEKLR
jgi:hypothetical protein